MYTYLILQIIGGILLFIGFIYVILKTRPWKVLVRKENSKSTHRTPFIATAFLIAGGIFIVFGTQTYQLHFAMPPSMHSMSQDGNPPSLPIMSAFNFFKNARNFEKIDDIGRDFNDVPPPITRGFSTKVSIDVETKEVISEVAPGIYNNYWTFNERVPGPMMRVRVGDDVVLNFTNHESSIHSHNIDLHAVTGPGGGAAITNLKPGDSTSFQWKALQPGLYIYHCATSNVSVHNSHGQYGMILVEPEEGLPPVDKEFYVVQGELYTQGGLGKKGLVAFDPKALLDGIPTYVTFNGKVQPDQVQMNVKRGEKVRMYVGNGGVNLISSFHVIGEIFDKVYQGGAIGNNLAILENVQTTEVLPGGSAIVEFTVDVPGDYILVDHALSRMNKGAWAILHVEGDKNNDVYRSLDLNEHSKKDGHDQH